MAFNDTFRLSVHAVITNPDSQVLQLKATYGNLSWGLPGGSLEPGETIHDALIRECLEEIGTQVNILYMSGMYYHKAYNSHACIFRCSIPENHVIQLSPEHSEFKYFSVDDLSPVQGHRILDCFNFDGKVKSHGF